jgi:predicted RNA-binding protein with PUA-like domain
MASWPMRVQLTTAQTPQTIAVAPQPSMTATRRSTRQTTSAAPRYNEDNVSSAEEEAPKRHANKTTRRKRAHDDDEEDVEQGSPPPKKAATTKAKASKAAASKPKVKPSNSDKPKSNPPPPPSNDTNRDADGSQQVYWLLKAEPLPRYENGVNVAFSISDLRACTKSEPWSGVRNPQARNNMKAMRKDDLGFFYHSNAKPSGVVGMLRVVEEAKVDETAFDPKDPYYDPKSNREDPKWWCVGVEFVQEFDKIVDLATIKEHAKDGGPLKDMQLVTNSRLSVSRVREEEWDYILGLSGAPDINEELEELDKEQFGFTRKEMKELGEEKMGLFKKGLEGHVPVVGTKVNGKEVKSAKDLLSGLRF